jgi:hypothetical protein
LSSNEEMLAESRAGVKRDSYVALAADFA